MEKVESSLVRGHMIIAHWAQFTWGREMDEESPKEAAQRKITEIRVYRY